MATSEKLVQPVAPPPQAILYQIATGHYFSRAVYVVAKLGIADLLAKGPQDSSEIARLTGTLATSLRRVLRLLASVGILVEQENGSFALTPIGDCLRSDVPGSFRSAALLLTGELEWGAWGELLHSVKTGEPAFHHFFGMDSFTYLEKHPEEGAMFDEAMAAFTKQICMAATAAYDFSQFNTIVDVGGGNGTLLAGILKANPSLRGVVFDLARAAEGAKKQIEASGLVGRCEVASGDFFAAVPSGGDAYILKHVIHDWDDERSTAILRNCHRAMLPHGKLLLIEGVYPPRIDQSAASRMAASDDVNMLVCTGGRQRSEVELRALFAAAGFQLTKIFPTRAISCVLEGIRMPAASARS